MCRRYPVDLGVECIAIAGPVIVSVGSFLDNNTLELGRGGHKTFPFNAIDRSIFSYHAIDNMTLSVHYNPYL